MTTPRWVQHKSGQGEKWKVLDVSYNTEPPEKYSWCVEAGIGIDRYYFLPKSEYREYLPPWRRVTGELKASGGPPWRSKLFGARVPVMALPDGLRWKLVTREDLAPGEVCIVVEEGE
jgi:hypothetical protein